MANSPAPGSSSPKQEEPTAVGTPILVGKPAATPTGALTTTIWSVHLLPGGGHRGVSCFASITAHDAKWCL